MFSLAVLIAPIYFITGPIVITNDGAPTLTKVVTQPLVGAADDSSLSNTKAEAALKAEVKRTQSPRNRPLAEKTHSAGRVASDAPAALPPATYPNFAPL